MSSRRTQSSRRPTFKRARKGFSRGRTKHKSLLNRKLNKKATRQKLEKVTWTFLGFVGIIALIGSIGFLFWLQRLTNELPDLDDPRAGLASSKVYDRNGVVLYSVSGDEFSRDLIKVDEFVKEDLKWAFLSAEDADFYEHPGVDFTAITRCAFRVVTGGDVCGGSTVTQQVVLNTILTREQSYVRKVKDIILALQLERKYAKDEILNIYLNAVPQGGGRIGVRTGAELYFGKDINELELEEIAVLASVIRNPSIYSPTIGSDLEANKERLNARTDYILGQMIENIDLINERIDIANENNNETEGYVEQEKLTVEKLEEAKEKAYALEFKEPKVNIKAPHFVFYVTKLLQERGYNNGDPFTESDIQTGGLQIYTTLDYGMQEIAEKYVSSDEQGHAGAYRASYNAGNSALMTLRPSTGEILTMVGSKCYQNNEYIPNCDELDETQADLFDPDVNILDTLQSPGSTNKAIGYYVAFKDGLIGTSSVIPDVPIDNALVPGYRPKNWNGAFSGKGDVRYFLARSLNIPALFLIDAFGVQNYVDTAKTFGYTTYTNPQGYGPSVILGGTDVKGIEHAQGFSVFANGGDFVQHEVILRIEDNDGNVLYEHEPERERIADPAAIYLVNNVLNPRVSGGLSPVNKISGRDVAGKTGTSENNRDTWFAVWSPEFVTVGWMGNNDNTRMSSQAFGSTSAAPWIQNYMNAIMGNFPDATPFARPGGIISTASVGCDAEGNNCASGGGLAVAGNLPPAYLEKQTVEVCIDQPDKLARPIDIASGFSQVIEIDYLKSPSERLQPQVDAYFQNQEGVGGIPTEECDISRTSDLTKPDAIIRSPKPGATYEDTMLIDINAFVGEGNISRLEFTLGSDTIGVSTDSSFNGEVDISGVRSGVRSFAVIIETDDGKTHTKRFNVSVGSQSTISSGTAALSAGSATVLPNTSTTLAVDYTGSRRVEDVAVYQTSSLTGVTTFVANMREVGDDSYEYNWSPTTNGEFVLYAVVSGSNFSLQTNPVTIAVGEQPEGEAVEVQEGENAEVVE